MFEIYIYPSIRHPHPLKDVVRMKRERERAGRVGGREKREWEKRREGGSEREGETEG